jgi:Protein of unknown function (DUF2809)
VTSNKRPRSRWLYAAFVIITIALGLGSRAVAAHLPSWLAKNAGDALYATMAFFLVGALAPRVRTRTAAAIAFGWSAAVEFSQALHPAWLDAIRETLPGRLVLGQGFHWSDLACYAVGTALGVAVETAIEMAYRGPGHHDEARGDRRHQ